MTDHRFRALALTFMVVLDVIVWTGVVLLARAVL